MSRRQPLLRFPTAQTRVGAVLRLPLRLIPPSTVVPVWRGPARGLRWIVGASTHGCWLGTYEAPNVRQVVRVLRPGQVFYDVGAHVGYYTLLAARLVGERGRVVAFEPVARNLALLRRHLRLNGLRNVEVRPVAVGSAPGAVGFAYDPREHSTGRLAATVGNLHVQVTTLDVTVEVDGAAVPDLIKIDVEGAEYDVLVGAQRLLERHRPQLLLSTHGEALATRCREFLSARGYTLSPLGSVRSMGSEWHASAAAAPPHG